MKHSIYISTLLIVTLIWFTSCSDSATGPNPPPKPITGTLKITAKTAGNELDPDGYNVAVGSKSTDLPTNGSVKINELTEGVAKVQLKDVAPNCTPTGSMPQKVKIKAGQTTEATIKISCKTMANGLIAFERVINGDGEIFLINTKGKVVRQLTNNNVSDSYPVISPNATKIAFLRYTDNGKNIEIFVMNADGSKVHQVTNSPGNDFAPSWSPDGSKIVFHSLRSGAGDIYTISVDGTNLQQITSGKKSDLYPDWSPDGSKIVFTSNRKAKGLDIYTISSDGGNLQRLTNKNPATGIGPRWSPDGSKIIFQSSRNGNIDMYMMSSNGNSIRRVTHNGSIDYVGSWSPDGSKIAFHSFRVSPPEIYIINVNNNGSPVRLTSNSVSDLQPFWSPVPKIYWK